VLAHLKDIGRVRFESAGDREVVTALKEVMKHEGIIPALESAHAFVPALKEAADMQKDEIILINQSGRGDKDIFTVADAIKDPAWKEFLREKAGEDYA
jgi:tryptophan synthase beta chain